MMEKLISVNWLKEHIEDNGLIILDASTHFDATQSIPGAQHFDIKNVFSDLENPLPNILPSPAQFENEVRKLGVSNNSTIIVFDNKGIFTSPRAWWMFTIMGFKNIAVLDGGLPEWKAHDLPIGTEVVAIAPQGDFIAHYESVHVKNYWDVLSNVATLEYQLIDARSAGRFSGKEPEPRPHLQSGHIQNSINLPYTEVLEDGKFKSKAALRQVFSELNLSKKPIIFSCGSGITACIILLALALISDHEKFVYDGSWTEWAEKQSLFAI